jgi:hypothetical protein
MKTHLQTNAAEPYEVDSVSRPEATEKPIHLTPKKVKLDLDTPLREHLDSAAMQRGWELFKQTR